MSLDDEVRAIVRDELVELHTEHEQLLRAIRYARRTIRADIRALADSFEVVDPEPPVPPAGRTLTDGTPVNARGVPDRGAAYVGGTTGSNTDPASLEAAFGATYGVRRTFWRADQVSSAVGVAMADVAAGRVPWVSFKLPHKWADMAAGKGDAWARDVVERLSAIEGPAWLAFHHEPENDGSAAELAHWTAMQERLGPLAREAPNVAFTVILMGWPNLYGKAEHRLDVLWPDTTVDVAGFDVYNVQGVTENGVTRTKPVDFPGDYFAPLADWADAVGARWALSETGYTSYTAERNPTWVRDTVRALVAHGGAAFAYFNTPLNSVADWTLSTDAKREDFAAALRGAPTLAD